MGVVFVQISFKDLYELTVRIQSKRYKLKECLEDISVRKSNGFGLWTQTHSTKLTKVSRRLLPRQKVEMQIGEKRKKTCVGNLDSVVEAFSVAIHPRACIVSTIFQSFGFYCRSCYCCNRFERVHVFDHRFDHCGF